MAPFITFRETARDGSLQYYILQRDFPHYCGLIVDNPNYATLMKVPLPGYTMYVSIEGVINGRYIPNNPAWKEEIYVVLNDMANWYVENRILKNPKKYKKWSLPLSTPLS